MLSLIIPNSVIGHDIWLFPEQFILAKGDTLIVHQLAGGELERELLQPNSPLELSFLWRMTPRFQLISPNSSVDLLRELPDIRAHTEIKPVLRRKVDFEGLTLVAMDHDLIYLTHTNDEFLQYLGHEEFRTEKFKDQMGSRSDQTEAYDRSLKTLVRVGNATGSDLYKRVLGQNIEILLLQNPYRFDLGDTMDVQVIFDGQPLGDVLVKAYNSDGKGPVTKSKVHTDAQGIASFQIDRKGFWLIRLVHLLPCSKRFNVDCHDAHWESHWSSYSFKLD